MLGICCIFLVVSALYTWGLSVSILSLFILASYLYNVFILAISKIDFDYPTQVCSDQGQFRYLRTPRKIIFRGTGP